jgi:HK97 family phage major capsid protein
MLRTNLSWKDEKLLTEKIGRALKEMDQLNEASESRSLTETEEQRYKELDRQTTAWQRQLDQTRKKQHARLSNNPNMKTANEALTPSSSEFSNDGSVISAGDDSIQTWKRISGPSKGHEVRAFDRSHNLADNIPDGRDSGFSWSDYLRARIQGHTASSSVLRDFMSTTSDAALVPTPLSAMVIDMARNKSRIFQSGAYTIPMDSKELTIARVTDDPAAQWKEENASHVSGEVGTEPLTFTSRVLLASCKMSVELSEDAPNADAIISNSIASQLALELDRAALVGSGAGAEPQGVYGYTGVQTETLSAALDSYDPFSQAYQKVLQANGEPNSIIYAPRTWGALDRLKDSNNQPLAAPASYNDLAKFATNQVPINLGAGEDESLAFLGDFRMMLVGIRTNLRLEVSRFASDDTNSAFSDLQVWVRGYLRADIQLAHPSHFCVIESIT